MSDKIVWNKEIFDFKTNLHENREISTPAK